MTTTDLHCLLCGAGESHAYHDDCGCDASLIDPTETGWVGPHHPFVPAPSTTDAIAEALRRVQQAHMCPKCGSLIDCVKEAAIVARERERYEARITDLKRASDVLYGLMPAFLNDDTAWQMAMGDMHAALAALDKPVQP